MECLKFFVVLSITQTILLLTGVSSNASQIRFAWFISSKSTPEQYGGNASTSVLALLYGLSVIPTLVSHPINISVVWYDDRCDRVVAAGGSMQFLAANSSQIFIGPSCDSAMGTAGSNAGFYNVPVITNSALSTDFSSTENNIIHMNIPGGRYAERIANMFINYGWSKALLIQCVDDYLSSIIGTAITAEFQALGYKLFPVYTSLNSSVTDIINLYQRLTTQFSYRIVILAVPTKLLREYLIASYQSGMTQLNYIFIIFDVTADFDITVSQNLWATGDTATDNMVLASLNNVMLNRVSFVATSTVMNSGSNSATLLSRVSISQFALNAQIAASSYLKSSNINSSGQLPSPMQVDIGTPVLYDQLYLTGLILNYSLMYGIDFVNSVNFINLARQFPFTGASGDVRIDANGERYTNWLEIGWNPSQTTWQVINYVLVSLDNQQNAVETVYPLNNAYWPDGSRGVKSAPSDTLCLSECNSMQGTTIYLIITGTAVGAFCLLFGAYYFIKNKRRMLSDAQWQLRFEDLSLGTERSTTGSRITDSTSDSHSVSDAENTSTDEMGTSISAATHRQKALLQGEVIWVKKLLQVPTIRVNPQNETRLREMRTFQHPNINSFLGIAINMLDVYVAWAYCSKGSLRDVLDDKAITVDQIFSLSFIADVLRGMDFLHRSPLQHHGRLTSYNILVDSKWTCKIGDYGFIETIFVPNQIRLISSGMASRASSKSQETREYTALLWVAPELMTQQFYGRHGTREGDIYSFGVICYEIITRLMPFSNYKLTPQSIVDQISAGKVFRPFSFDQLAQYVETPDELKRIAQDCISPLAEERPTFEAIMKSVGKIKGFSKTSNAVENLIRMMEKYTANLEQVVAERTRRLMEEEKKAEALLYKMLPRKIADDLKQGKSIPAESYDNVSIYFSDVVNFTVLCGESSPMEVINFLNKLYGCFDDIIARHDVYKVETIGDAYMIAGGIPDPSDRHATEIADCALNIMLAVERFEIPHKPGRKLEIRIGVHSGPCCAGVVGFQMPRYCLFGDTINTASRMESHGSPMHIQISQSTRSLLIHRGEYLIRPRGEMQVKGKGAMYTYWLIGKVRHTDFSRYIKEDECASS